MMKKSIMPQVSAMPETDAVAYFRDLLTGVALSHMELDSKLRPFVSRPMQDLDLMELALLRLAMYEMTRREDVPHTKWLSTKLSSLRKYSQQKTAISLLTVCLIKLHRTFVRNKHYSENLKVSFYAGLFCN